MSSDHLHLIKPFISNFKFMSSYIALSQEEHSDKDESIILRPHHPSTWRDVITSPTVIGSVLILILATNIVCFSIATKSIRSISMTLRSHLDLTDTRDLPRPDQYEGLLGPWFSKMLVSENLKWMRASLINATFSVVRWLDWDRVSYLIRQFDDLLCNWWMEERH